MVTGASDCRCSHYFGRCHARRFFRQEPVLLPQTKRHSAILKLLGCPNIIVAVNKLDLLDFDEAKYQAITEAYRKLAEQIGLKAQIHFLPISALKGDNIVNASSQTHGIKGCRFCLCLKACPSTVKMPPTKPRTFPYNAWRAKTAAAVTTSAAIKADWKRAV